MRMLAQVGLRSFVAVGLCFLLSLGCGTKPPTDLPASNNTVNKQPTAVELVSQMLKTYSAAKSYRDRAVIRLSYQAGGEKFQDEQTVAVAWQRPNQLRVNAYQLTILADGKQLFAQIIDPTTNNVDQQVVYRPVPEAISLADLSGDALLHDVLLGRVQRVPLPLEMLLDPAGLEKQIAQPGACERLKSAFWHDHGCERIEVKTPTGPLVLWIDENEQLLRRVDYPAAQWFPDLALDSAVRELELIADIEQPQLNESLPAKLFAIELPADAKKMRSFVVPPKPLPTDLFGQKTPDVQFIDLEGKPVSSKDAAGSIQIWMWFANHLACQPALEQLDQVRMEMKGEKRLQFRAVCTEPQEVTNVQLKQLLSQWQVGLPVVRDFGAAGRDIFKIKEVPTLVILDGEGRVQIFDERHQPELVHQLPLILQRLLKGEDLVKEVVAQTEAERKKYAELVAAGGPEPAKVIELPQSVIAAASMPKEFRLEERFTQNKISQPGNLLVIAGNQPRIYVVAGTNRVIELDPSGKQVAEHQPELPAGGSFAWLRTAVDKNGKRWFLAGSPLAAQVFVFDAEWKLQLAYPPADQRHEGVRDAHLFDLDRDGVPELYVGFWSLHGVHGVQLDGSSIFRQRAKPTVLSLGMRQLTGDEFPQLLLTTPAGSLIPANRFGNFDPEINVTQRAILQIAAASYGTSEPPLSSFATVTSTTDSKLQVLGLSADFQKIQWQADLPPGVHHKPVEFLTSGPLPSAAGSGWLLAGADGSLQLISDDGKFRDSWNSGEQIAGIALTKFGDDVVLLLAGERALRAWNLKAK